MVGAVIEPRGRCPLNLYSSTGSRQEANSVDISLQQKSVEHRESIFLGAEPCWRRWEGSQDRDDHNKMEERGEGGWGKLPDLRAQRVKAPGQKEHGVCLGDQTTETSQGDLCHQQAGKSFRRAEQGQAGPLQSQ